MVRSGEASTVESVLGGRRFPYSRAFARAGFNRLDAEVWRQAGWLDPVEAAAWRDLEGDCTPAQLFELSRAGIGPEQVRRTARFAPHHTAAWLRAVTAPPSPDAGASVEGGGGAADRLVDLRDTPARHEPDDDADIDLRDGRTEAELRAAVTANLHREQFGRAGGSATDLR